MQTKKLKIENPAAFVYHLLFERLAASFALASCAAPGGTSVPQTTRVAYYPQCYQSVTVLRQQDQQFQQTMAVNTLAGAVGGAALGGLIGRDWQSALIGAAAGAVT